ncbi:MAG: glycosyltransferase family 1 protein [Candidatus Sulfotelmatobacter sp.]
MSYSRPHVGLVGMDQWLGGAIYTQNLIKALLRLPADERPRITLFCRRNTAMFTEVTPLVDNVVVFESPLDKVFAGTKFAGIAQRIDYSASAFLFGDVAPALGRAAKREKIDAIFPVPDPYTRLTPNAIAWIPDLQHCAFPEHFTKLNRRVRDNRFSQLLRDANRHVVFSSQCALEHATSVYGTPRAQTHILHFATVPLPEWFDDPAPVVAKYKLDTPFVIVCNQFWVHKDHITLFKGIAKLKQQGVKVNLVCTGPTKDPRQPEHFSNLQAQIKNLGIESQVRILGVIPRIDQVALIRASEAVCQPSQFEGWSTVIEDARALGKPLIASDFPVHLEQDIPGSHFFRMGDADDFALTLTRFLQKGQAPVYSRSVHDARILEFARDFLNIVDVSRGVVLPVRDAQPVAR